MASLIEELRKDVRFIEGLKSCINCGICTAICPAAEFHNYDPRDIVGLVQRGNETEIENILKSDTIWYCGQCLSCKTRCPRGNTPGYIIQALRNLAQQNGYYAYSKRGRQQLQVKRIVGDTMLQYGYCIYIDKINTEDHPEQGPIWDWYRQNAETLMKKFGANYKGKGAGTLREISAVDLHEFKSIFKETGAIKRFETIEKQHHDEE